MSNPILGYTRRPFMRIWAAVWLWAAVLILAPLGALAQQQAQSGAYDWQAAMLSSSQRLKLFALSVARPEGAGDFVAQLQRAQGLRGAGVVGQSLSVAPILRYDANINGGIPSDTIYIGSFPFTVSPDSRAKSGIVVGLAPSAQMRLAFGRGLALDLSVYASVARSFQHDLSVRTFGGALCAQQYIGGTNWVDICAGASGSRRDLNDSNDRYASWAISRQFRSRVALHEARLRLRNTWTDSYDKASLELSVSSANRHIGLIEASFDLGERIDGQHTRLWGGNLSRSWGTQDRSTRTYIAFGHEAGAKFFGVDRVDNVVAVGLTRGLGGWADVTLSVSRRRSTLSAYDGVTAGFDISLKSWRF